MRDERREGFETLLLLSLFSAQDEAAACCDAKHFSIWLGLKKTLVV
jgi:hypothetical protein